MFILLVRITSKSPINPHNKDPTQFIEKVVEDLFVFTDQLQGVSNLPEGYMRITAIDFDY